MQPPSSSSASPAALLEHGLALIRAGRFAEALRYGADFRARFPTEPEARILEAEALLSARRHAEALDAFGQLARVHGETAYTRLKCGLALAALGRMDESRALLAKAQPGGLDADNAFLWSRWLALGTCDWRDRTRLLEELERCCADPSVRLDRALAFASLILPTSPELRHALARKIASAIEARCPVLPPLTRQPHGGPLRVGLLSPDFREHLNAYLILPLLELGDRSRIEYYAYSLGADDGSAVRGRVRAAAHRFRDLSTLGDQDAAAQIRRDGIDVLVDLGGHTDGARFEIVARRPAPVQVLYLGYSGTLGSARVDHVLADRIVLSEGEADHWAEKPVYLPHCWFLYDFRSPPVGELPARKDHALPEDALVFAAFHRAEKLDPESFGLWMQILRGAPGSVLWLYAAHEEIPGNLRREAAARGVNPDRLVIAPIASRDRHQSRLRLADLSLDSLHHNATTSACDSLAAGVPVLTLPGTTFTSRTCASLLQAAGLPELVMPDGRAFVDYAVRCALEPGRIGALKDALARNRDSAPLFDTASRVRDLEAVLLSLRSAPA